MIAIVGDPHLRDGDDIISRIRRYSFEQMYRVLEDLGVRLVIVTGDLFDKPVVSPDLVSFVVCCICCGNQRGIETWILAGNHDTRLDTGCGVDYLGSGGGNASIVETGVKRFSWYNMAIGLVPFVAGSSAKDEIIRLGAIEPCNLVVGHFGIYGLEGVSCGQWLRKDPWYVDADSIGFKCPVVIGHNHEMFYDKEWRIYCVGAMNPCKRNEVGSFGNVVLYDPAKRRVFDFLENAIPGMRYTRTEGHCHISTDGEGTVVDVETDVNDLIGKSIQISKPVSVPSIKVGVIEDPESSVTVESALHKYIDSLDIDLIGIESDAVSLVSRGECASGNAGVPSTFHSRFSGFRG